MARQNFNFKRRCIKFTALSLIYLLFNVEAYPIGSDNDDIFTCKTANGEFNTENIKQNDCNDIGTLGIYKISVPKKYILGPSFVYDGVDIWKNNPSQDQIRSRTIDDKVSYFSIRIKLDDLKPIESNSDKLSFDKFMDTLPENRHGEKEWILVTFEKAKDLNLYYKFKNIAQSKYTGFFINSGKEFGLTRFQSPNGPLSSKNPEDSNEIWLETESNNTIFYCANYRRSFQPFHEGSLCHHDFRIGQDIVAEVGMIGKKIEYLKNWADTEKRLNALFMSFVVKQ